MFQCVRCRCWIKTAKGLKSILIMNLNDISDECVKNIEFHLRFRGFSGEKNETFQTTKVLVDTHTPKPSLGSAAFLLLYFFILTHRDNHVQCTNQLGEGGADVAGLVDQGCWSRCSGGKKKTYDRKLSYENKPKKAHNFSASTAACHF